jgi:aminoglycoside 3-N-acetyltransferase
MIYRMQRVLPQRLQAYVAPMYRGMRRHLAALDRTFDKRALSTNEFAELLTELGVATGATVMVHSSMDEIARRVPSVTPLRFIGMLLDLLGPEGTLLMATFPFLGRQLDYVNTHQVFDPRKTPSQVGLITETFRRMPGVIRSLHPTHPIAARGKHARELTESHPLGSTFGETSPLFKMQHFGGLVIGLGTGFRRFTILHVPEELHAKTRRHVFDEVPRVMTIVGEQHRMPYPLMVMRASIERNYERVEKLLLQDGTLRNIDRKGLKCAVAPADRLIRRGLALIEQDLYFFD